MASITKTTVEALLREPAGSVVRDSKLTGFQARRLKSGVFFYYEYRNGHGRSSDVRRISIGEYGSITPGEARKIAKAHSLSVANGNDPVEERKSSSAVPRLDEFAETYLDGCEAVAKNHPESAPIQLSSLLGYRGLMNNHIGPALGRKKLDQIATGDVKAFHTKLSATQPIVSNRCLELISSLYKQAALLKHVPPKTNPVFGVTMNKEREIERYLTTDELVRLGEALHIGQTVGIPWVPPSAKPGKDPKYISKARKPYVLDDGDADVIRCLALSGRRLREWLNAQWKDINFEHGTLTRFTKTGKRVYRLSTPVLEILQKRPRVGPWVFPSVTDSSKHKADVNRAWRKIRQFAGLDCRLHDLRHSFASIAAAGGASLLMIGKLLGHTQMRSTMRYAALTEDPVKSAVEHTSGHIEGVLRGAPGKISIIRS